jgi:hypothetical protein
MNTEKKKSAKVLIYAEGKPDFQIKKIMESAQGLGVFLSGSMGKFS